MTNKSSPIFGDTVFCDDIRFEVGHKYSLIGIYNGAMFFPEGQQFPITLPKFCMSVRMYMPFDTVPKRIELLVYFPGNTEEPGYRQVVENLPPRRKVVEDVDETDLRGVFVTPVIFSPMQLTSIGSLKVRANVDGEIIKLGSLFIRTQPIPAPPTS